MSQFFDSTRWALDNFGPVIYRLVGDDLTDTHSVIVVPNVRSTKFEEFKDTFQKRANDAGISITVNFHLAYEVVGIWQINTIHWSQPIPVTVDIYPKEYFDQVGVPNLLDLVASKVAT